MGAVFNQIAEFEAVEQWLDRTFERGPFRFVGRLDGKINFLSCLRLRKRRVERRFQKLGYGLDDNQQSLRGVLRRPES